MDFGSVSSNLDYVFNKTNILSSVYDSYQITGNPEYYDKKWMDWNDNWPYAYPQDIAVNSTNQFTTFGSVSNLTNPSQKIDTYATCDKQMIKYAKEDYEAEVAKQDLQYQARFIDGATYTVLFECYHPDHPQTRRESMQYRLKLLQYFRENEHGKIVIGSEDGKDIAVPYCDYFLGLMSPAPFRVPGTDTSGSLIKYWDEPTEAQTRVMTNESVRVPLFQLVYHDCAISYWGGDDHNSKVIPLWDKRDLLNRLYGTPPVYVIMQHYWDQYKDRFVKSYKIAQPVSRLTGYAEMIDHIYLTDDMKVQQTIFSNDVSVIANFGSSGYSTIYGDYIEPMGSVVYKNFSTIKVASGMDGWIIGVIVAVVLLFVAGVCVFIMIKMRKTDQ